MTTLAALEHQWAESCTRLTEAHELVRRLTVQHSSLGARIARMKQAARRKRTEPCPTTGPTCPAHPTDLFAAARPPT